MKNPQYHAHDIGGAESGSLEAIPRPEEEPNQGGEYIALATLCHSRQHGAELSPVTALGTAAYVAGFDSLSLSRGAREAVFRLPVFLCSRYSAGV